MSPLNMFSDIFLSLALSHFKVPSAQEINLQLTALLAYPQHNAERETQLHNEIKEIIKNLLQRQKQEKHKTTVWN
jgi:hypothetical protein